MKTKHIKFCIRRKMTGWLKTIDDPELRDMMRDNIIITGGSIVSLLLGEQPNDYDVYFRNQETAYKVAQYYVKKFLENPPPRFKHGENVKIVVQKLEDRVKIVVKSAGIAAEGTGDQPADQPVDSVMMTRDEQGNIGYEYFELNADETAASNYVEAVENAATAAAKKAETEVDDPDKRYRPVFLSSNAITLSHGIQVIVRFFGDVGEIHENYDYVHCTCSYDFESGKLETPENALLAIINRELRYVGSKYPICSLIRMRKYLERGWRITAGQIAKMCWDVSQLDLNDIRVLEEQLVGVDAAYFHEILQILKEDREKGRKDIDRSYLMAVIDKVF